MVILSNAQRVFSVCCLEGCVHIVNSEQSYGSVLPCSQTMNAAQDWSQKLTDLGSPAIFCAYNSVISARWLHYC